MMRSDHSKGKNEGVKSSFRHIVALEQQMAAKNARRHECIATSSIWDIAWHHAKTDCANIVQNGGRICQGPVH